MSDENKNIEIEQNKNSAEKATLYKRVFGGPDGQAILKDLESRCYAKHTTFSGDYGTMAFCEGRRSIYMHIKNLLDADVKDALEGATKKE